MGPRRSHRKSRNGCPECKARRLKCDERYPCTNCVKHGINCGYVPPQSGSGTTQASPMSTSTPSMQPPHDSARLLPASHEATPTGYYPWEHNTSHARPESENRTDLLRILPSSPYDLPSNNDDWGLDLELMHHYCTVTCNTLALREDARHVWRAIIPTEGYANRYVMHGILAIAALHRAYLYSATPQKEKYVKASAYHLASGLTEFRGVIASPIDPQNWQPVFCFASMISIHLTASPIRLGLERWPSPISNVLELFASIKGFQVVMKPFISSLQTTHLAPLVNAVWLDHPPLIPSLAFLAQSMLPADTWTQIEKLRQFIDKYPFPRSQTQSHHQTTADAEDSNEHQDHRVHYNVALETFEKATRQIELAGPHVESGMVFLWAYPLSKEFHDDLETYHPVALVLLAHYCVLMHMVDHLWFINGIGRQLLEDIESKILIGYRDWLTWPRRWVYGR